MAKHPPRKDWFHRAPDVGGLQRFEAFFPAMVTTFTATTPTPSAIPWPAYRVISTAVAGGTACQARRWCCTRTKSTMEKRVPRPGSHYRMMYIEPALIQQMLGGQPLPFIKDGLSTDPRLFAATQALLRSLDCPLEPLEEQDALFDLAQALNGAGGVTAKRGNVDYVAAERAREYMHSALDRTVTLEELAHHSGRDRWSLSRDFRLLFGTSPYRYLTMRRLDLVRALLIQGQSLVSAALIAGFTDQSHMTRQFSKTYGLSPARWMKMLRR